MNWKQLFCIHEYIPISREHYATVTDTDFNGGRMDVYTVRKYKVTYECVKCDKQTIKLTQVNVMFDIPQPFDSKSTQQLFKD